MCLCYQPLAYLCGCKAWFASDLVENAEDVSFCDKGANDTTLKKLPEVVFPGFYLTAQC